MIFLQRILNGSGKPLVKRSIKRDIGIKPFIVGWSMKQKQALICFYRGDMLRKTRIHSNSGTSCAGHLEAGESPEDGVRELKEELGLHISSNTLHKVGIFKYNGEDVAKKVIDHEFCHVYALVRKAETLEDYQPAIGEVSGLYLISLEEMKQLCRGLKQNVAIDGYEIDDNGVKTELGLRIDQDDLVKNDPLYYERLFTCLDNLGIK